MIGRERNVIIDFLHKTTTVGLLAPSNTTCNKLCWHSYNCCRREKSPMIKWETIKGVFCPPSPHFFHVSCGNNCLFLYFDRNVSGHSNDNCFFKLCLKPVNVHSVLKGGRDNYTAHTPSKYENISHKDTRWVSHVSKISLSYFIVLKKAAICV